MLIVAGLSNCSQFPSTISTSGIAPVTGSAVRRQCPNPPAVLNKSLGGNQTSVLRRPEHCTISFFFSLLAC